MRTGDHGDERHRYERSREGRGGAEDVRPANARLLPSQTEVAKP